MRGSAALSLLVLMSGIRTTAAGTCAPRAQLAGNADVVVRVASELHRLGVATEPAPPGCRAVEAAVERDAGGGIAVAIRDAAQRTEGRVVGDAAIAAVWIDSWLRVDFVGFEASTAPPAMTSVTAPLQPDRVDAAAPVAPVAPASLLDRVSLDAGYEQTWSDDGSSWSGFGTGACVHLGFACVGLRAHGVFQPRLDAGSTAASRSDLSALATVRTTFSLGRMAISPELGVGVSRISTSRIDGCKPLPPPPNCNPSDPTCNAPPQNCADASGAVFVGDNFSATTYAPRAAAAVRLSIPLLEHVWLEGVASIAATPLRHADGFAPPALPNTGPVPALPGEPLTAYQLGVGLRIGAP